MTSPVYTVVNVEGHQPAQHSRATLLRAAGYRVIEAADNEEACRMVQQERPALLLLQEPDDERFRILADDAAALVWVNGPDGCEFVNKTYLDFLDVRDQIGAWPIRGAYD
jgi:CheY-like chemotaxis protein